jgi:hypothetical protein
MDRTGNTVPLLLHPIVAVETRLFAYLAIVAQQRVYMPQYYIGNLE